MRESLMNAQAVAVLEPPVTEGERSEAGGAGGSEEARRTKEGS